MMKVKVTTTERLEREVTYHIEVPDNWDLNSVRNEHAEELDALLQEATPEFGDEWITDVETDSMEKLD